ncbi:hypothetical protein N7495_004756 [Penicillium taxi]|uniref:uncharacterized protein n=1 Tax=Penicillium taxi TaxID=168475 RepID=UPI002545B417|nr:uncharacterized protein N7495_004756 [Penicillium taxi]KAJ5900012.1 hypothetical protein N7495_004756 [Penicillium taxi]
MATMKALVYKAPGTIELQTRPKPVIQASTDAIIRILHASICGTDLHVLKGDVPTIQPGLIMGHEGVGIVEEVGASVHMVAAGDRVVIVSQTCCGFCKFCRTGAVSHCEDGGWQLGNKIDGTQAEYVRIMHANLSLYKISDSITGHIALMFSDVLPTSMECGTLHGNVQPGNTVVIIGAGPIGISCLLTARLYSPMKVVMVDVDNGRLDRARAMGVEALNSKDPNSKDALLQLTDGRGFDSVIEAVGIPATFELAQELVAVGGSIANVGVHGTKVDLHLEKLWDRNISEYPTTLEMTNILIPEGINTQLLNGTTIPQLMRLVESGILDVSCLVTHSFPITEGEKAYSTFQTAAQSGALKVTIDMC